jgi:hypothetical protein
MLLIAESDAGSFQLALRKRMLAAQLPDDQEDHADDDRSRALRLGIAAWSAPASRQARSPFWWSRR